MSTRQSISQSIYKRSSVLDRPSETFQAVVAVKSILTLQPAGHPFSYKAGSGVMCSPQRAPEPVGGWSAKAETNLPKVAIYVGGWLRKSCKRLDQPQPTWSFSKPQHPDPAESTCSISKHGIQVGRVNLEPSQAAASMHRSPHRVRVRVRVLIGWSSF